MKTIRIGYEGKEVGILTEELNKVVEAGEYERLNLAASIKKEAAYSSASWGMFQIMGFNHKACGKNTVMEFVEMMCKSMFGQMILFARFVHGNKNLSSSLINKDWENFALYYNGKGYKQNSYDTKLLNAYNKYC